MFIWLRILYYTIFAKYIIILLITFSSRHRGVGQTLKFNLHIIGRAKKRCEFNQKRCEFKILHYLSIVIVFWCSWNWTSRNLESFHYVIEVFCHTQSTCWQSPFKDSKIWTCFLLFKPLSNVLKFIMGSNILHKKGHMVYMFKCTSIEFF